jgi:hypothetical protein
MGFYIINKEKMDILFCRPLSVKADETEVDSIVKTLLEFYVQSEEQPLLKDLQVLRFSKSKVVFMSKYSFLFILLSPSNYSTEMISSQLFFFMKLFLNAFEIKDENSANEFLSELEGVKRREISESLSHSFMLWNVLDLHVEDIDKRNLIEVYENILNSIWIGIRLYLVENETKITANYLQEVKKTMDDYLKKNTYLIKEKFTLEEEEGFSFCDIDIQRGTTVEIKREFLMLLKEIVDLLKDKIGEKELRQILASKTPSIIKVEWERMMGLGILQDVLNIVWR